MAQVPVIGRVLALVCLLAVLCLSACGEAPTAGDSLAMPTVAIRHRDALPLVFSLTDFGESYSIEEMYRMDKGRGWDERSTRLSGYRSIYTSDQAVLSQIQCQVECYLSVQDAQHAYRVYKEQLSQQLKGEVRYESVGESQEEALGDWSWVFKMEAREEQTLHYLFLRENVLVAVAFTGRRSPNLPDQAVRYARSLDQRIYRH